VKNGGKNVYTHTVLFYLLNVYKHKHKSFIVDSPNYIVVLAVILLLQ
jgi:hypothetical protein